MWAQGAQDTSSTRWGGLGRVLAWIGTALILLLVSLPVILLPLSTAVPAWAWTLLALGDVALIAGLIRQRGRPWVGPACVGGCALVATLAVLASQLFAATPAIRDAAGRIVPGSIASLERVNLNGTEQWITIRGRNVGNPVLLHLGMGGPGGGGFATRSLFEPLEEHFTIVSWDEPGTGKSINAVPHAELTRERFVEGARALTDLLRKRFGVDRIYLYGVSWTSILGIWLVQAYPDRYHAFISSGQMVNTTENDRRGYQLALDYARRNRDQAKVTELERNGPPPYHGPQVVGRYAAYLDVLNVSMGSPALSVIVPVIPFVAPEYGLVDKVNHTIGLMRSFDAVYPQLQNLDLIGQASELKVPVYFFVGRHDVNALADIAERYFHGLRAPHKELIWLQGGHGLDADTQGQFVDVMVHRILTRTR